MVVSAFINHSLELARRYNQPKTPEDDYLKDLTAALVSMTGIWNERAIKTIQVTLAVALKDPRIKNLSINSNQPQYDPLTILVLTKTKYKENDMGKNDLVFVQHGIDRYVLSKSGILDVVDFTQVRPANEIEVAAFYGSCQAQFVKVVLTEHSFAHYLEPYFNPQVEVIADVDEVKPLEVTIQSSPNAIAAHLGAPEDEPPPDFEMPEDNNDPAF